MSLLAKIYVPTHLRYSPSKSAAGIRLSPQRTGDLLLGFGYGGSSLHKPKRCMYLSTTQCSATKARSALALTYTPAYVHGCAIEDSSTLVNYWNRPEPARVWPAFGEIGGGREIMLLAGEALVCAVKRLGVTRYGQFRGDSTRSRILLRVAVLAARSMGAIENEKAHVSGKITAAGLAVSATGPLNYTVSCAVDDACKEGIRLRLWGVAWVDDERTLKRALWGPFIRDCFYPTKDAKKIASDLRLGGTLVALQREVATFSRCGSPRLCDLVR